jgi:hypothetical protein
MLTRDALFHRYPAPLKRVGNPGFVRVTRVKNITHTWAVTRPHSGYDPVGAPFYVPGMEEGAKGLLLRGATPTVTPSRPNVAMDPSDSTTWQRQYRFTN